MKFSIITPAYDIAKWLSPTIESVLSQAGDFSIEYIVVVNDSPDETLGVAQHYQQKVEGGIWDVKCNGISMQIIEAGKPQGMYVALNEGFGRATGDVFAWIAGDDIYEPGAFGAMKEIFTAYPDIAWVKGITSTIGDRGERLKGGTCTLYHQDWIRLGVYGMEAHHIEQDSNFWRAGVWKQVGAFPTYFKSAGDYWLWPQMAKYARLWSADVAISCFRKRMGQDSRANHDRLIAQKKSARPHRPLGAWIPRFFFWPYYRFPALGPTLRKAYRFAFPFKDRTYLAKENGAWVKKTMSSFSL